METRLDAILGAHLWQSSAADIKKLFTRAVEYENSAGKVSGIKMRTFLEII